MSSDEYLCGICELNCDSSCICCDSCQTWMHYCCLDFDQTIISALESELVNEQYFCIHCSSEDGTFKYHESLARLKKGRTFQELRKVAKMEEIMIPHREFTRMEDDDLILSVNQDEYVNTILEKYNTPNFKALSSTSNGNSLFNSVSLVLFGSEDYATELRVRTCLAMVLNTRMILCEENANLSKICGTYEMSCLKCASDKYSSNAYTIAALSMAVNITFLSIYPPQNGFVDESFTYLNRYFKPGSNEPAAEIVLFWSGYYDEKGSWTAHHFVPLVRVNPNACPKIIANDDHNYVNPRLPRKSVEMEVDNPPEETSSNPEDTPLGTVDSSVMDEDSDENTGPPITCLPGVSVCERLIHTPRGIYECISSSEHILDDYPAGIKSNCLFILKYKGEIESNHPTTFPDDCGSWCHSRFKIYQNNFYTRHKFKLVHKRKKGYCSRTALGEGKFGYVKINPQPEEEDVIKVVQYQVTHTCSKDFIRRISYLIDPKYPEISGLLLYQYKGTQPKNLVIEDNDKRIADIPSTDIPGVFKCEKFISPSRDIYECIISCRYVLDVFPECNKSNCQFIYRNKGLYEDGQRKPFYDYLKEWDYETHGCRTDLCMRGTFKIIYEREKKYYYKRAKNELSNNLKVGDFEFEMINPQPKPEDTIKVGRYTTPSRLSKDFVRRIAYIVDPMYPSLSELCLYQYVGIQP